MLAGAGYTPEHLEVARLAFPRTEDIETDHPVPCHVLWHVPLSHFIASSAFNVWLLLNAEPELMLETMQQS